MDSFQAVADSQDATVSAKMDLDDGPKEVELAKNRAEQAERSIFWDAEDLDEQDSETESQVATLKGLPNSVRKPKPYEKLDNGRLVPLIQQDPASRLPSPVVSAEDVYTGGTQPIDIAPVAAKAFVSRPRLESRAVSPDDHSSESNLSVRGYLLASSFCAHLHFAVSP